MKTVSRKPCQTCKVVKTLRMFYRTSARNRDGHMNVCKDCHNKYVRENREMKSEQYRATDRRYDASPNRVAARAAYRKTEAGKAAARRAHRAQRAMSPEKYRARMEVAKALRKGELTRQPCQVCGDVKSEAHHDDYSQPLNVRWLCNKHHREHHRNEHERLRSQA